MKLHGNDIVLNFPPKFNQLTFTKSQHGDSIGVCWLNMLIKRLTSKEMSIRINQPGEMQPVKVD